MVKLAWNLPLEYQPKAIILDIGLPQINGWTVMERLKDNPNTRHIPVHFISATNQSSTAKKMGAIGYLHKPVNKEQLENVLEKIDIFISDSVKNVLVIADNKSHQQQILELVGGEKIQTTLAVTTEATLQHLQTTVFDCIVLDLNIEPTLRTSTSKKIIY
jgi:CheY-like chemotaxis protein